MKAVLYHSFCAPPELAQVDDPHPEPHGVVVRVMATGLCRSDWHGWRGHDPDITPPHVPGHEWAGVIAAVGGAVQKYTVGDRVTAPFVGGCGACPQCHTGNQQVCDRQFQPGFTHWGSFAEYVSIHYADLNLVRLPDALDFTTAASLGCRFATSFRAVIDQGQTKSGDQVVIFGCGGAGLSAVMIAVAAGAAVIAVDIDDEALKMASDLGAAHCLNADKITGIPQAVRDLTGGGAHLSIDAIGAARACYDGICALRKRGRHVQIGLMAGDDADPAIPMGKIIADELELVGSHGMQAWRYDEMMPLVMTGRYAPEKLVTRRIPLTAAPAALTAMGAPGPAGVTVIDQI